jgi:hypothetical protein
MRVALAAGDSRALHPHAHISYLDDILLGDGQPVPDSNLVSELKTALSQQMQR